MAAKTAKTYTLEELKEKAKLALNIPRLVEIVINSPNPNQARDRAYQYAAEETHDLKDAKKLADSARFLAMLRRSSQEEFEKLITHAEQPKPNVVTIQKKNFSDYEFELPLDHGHSGKLLTREEIYGGGVIAKSHFVKFEDSIFVKKMVGEFCLEIISALLETLSESDRGTTPLLDLIQLLEEKCGLKVKVCGNCRHFEIDPEQERKACWYAEHYPPVKNPFGRCYEPHKTSTPNGELCEALPKSFNDTYDCNRWTLKEVSEKK